MLSRKYYQMLATLIGESQDLPEFRRKLVDALEADNPRFQVGRWNDWIYKTQKKGMS